MYRHLVRFALLALIALGASPLASAQDEENGGGALDLNEQFQHAARRAGRGDVTGAIRTFKEIAEQDPYWSDVFFNIAQLSEHVEMWQDCALYYRRYIFLEPEADDLERVRRQMERCEEHIPNAGHLVVTGTTPPGVQIALNGLVLGEGSLGPIALAAGTYTLTAERTDFDPYSATVTVQAEQTLETTVEMQAMTFFGTISLNVSEAGASVTVNGESRGTTPLAEPIRLPEGRYLVAIHKDGFHDWQRYIDVLRDENNATDVRLISLDVDLDDL